MNSKKFKCWCGYEDSDFLRFSGHVYSTGHDKIPIEEENKEIISEGEEKEEEEKEAAKEEEEKGEEEEYLVPIGFEEFVDEKRKKMYCLFCMRDFKLPERWAAHIQKYHYQEFRDFLKQKGFTDEQVNGLCIALDLIKEGKWRRYPELTSKV